MLLLSHTSMAPCTADTCSLILIRQGAKLLLQSVLDSLCHLSRYCAPVLLLCPNTTASRRLPGRSPSQSHWEKDLERNGGWHHACIGLNLNCYFGFQGKGFFRQVEALHISVCQPVLLVPTTCPVPDSITMPQACHTASTMFGTKKTHASCAMNPPLACSYSSWLCAATSSIRCCTADMSPTSHKQHKPIQ